MRRLEKNDKSTPKNARGKVGRSLVRRTIELAKERVKKKEYKQDFESESSSPSERRKTKKSIQRPKFGCVSECKVIYKEKGKLTKCVAI